MKLNEGNYHGQEMTFNEAEWKKRICVAHPKALGYRLASCCCHISLSKLYSCLNFLKVATLLFPYSIVCRFHIHLVLHFHFF